jgi:exocyst complex component 1
MCAMHRKMAELEDTNQDFITSTLQKECERLSSLFSRFVDEQIHAIEDTKVKIKKRRGVIAFMNTFPRFSHAIETMLNSSLDDTVAKLEVRSMVDAAYVKINKAMWESLKVIAKESPAVMATQGQGDPEDKEALNYHILLIENMNHFVEEVTDHGDEVLKEWRKKAQEDMAEHMELYVDAVIRRPLGKLLVSASSIIDSFIPGSAADITTIRNSSNQPKILSLLFHPARLQIRSPPARLIHVPYLRSFSPLTTLRSYARVWMP